MYKGEIVIHDARGFTQADRRQLLLTQLELERQARAAHDLPALTWTEEADGVTIYLGGVYEHRVTYAELAQWELEAEGETRGACDGVE